MTQTQVYELIFLAKRSFETFQKKFENFLNRSNGLLGAIKIIYLSGIVNDENLSKHLRSRFGVEDILRASGVNLTVLRAGIIIGSGSASFEIIRDLDFSPRRFGQCPRCDGFFYSPTAKERIYCSTRCGGAARQEKFREERRAEDFSIG